MQYLIMCRSLTNAQRAASVLEKKGITATIIKAPQGISTSGCAYALSLYRYFDEASKLLKNNGLLTGKRFKNVGNGEYTEVRDALS